MLYCLCSEHYSLNYLDNEILKIKNNYHSSSTIRLWWIVCIVNGITNPFIKPTPDTRIKILNRNIVDEIVAAIVKN
jgi:hypothetical protein